MPKFRLPATIRSTFHSYTASIRWGGGDIDYAGKVHKGRPWTDVTIARQKERFVDTIARHFNRTTDLRRAFEMALDDLNVEFDRTIDSYDWGREGRGRKRFRSGRTYKTITDSGSLRRSRKMKVRRSD